jgi:hypothetical protein
MSAAFHVVTIARSESPPRPFYSQGSGQPSAPVNSGQLGLALRREIRLVDRGQLQTLRNRHAGRGAAFAAGGGEITRAVDQGQAVWEICGRPQLYEPTRLANGDKLVQRFHGTTPMTLAL